MQYVILATISLFTISILLRSPLKEWFLDLPDERKQHQRLIPRMGGFGLLIVFLLATLGIKLELFHLPHTDSKLVYLSLISAFCFVIIGLFDDSNMVSIWLRKRNQNKDEKKPIKWELPVRYKFLLEFSLSAYTVWSLKIHGMSLFIFSHEYKVNYVILGLLVIWIVGVMNAFNIIDGLDTLCGGVSLLTFITIAYVAHLVGNETTMGLSLMLVAIILGFLYHNFPPANVFMGDAGSLFMGFWAAVLPLSLAISNPNRIHFEAMVLFAGLPVLDVFVAMFRRFFMIGRGKKLKARLRCMVSADANHLHHKFIYFGLSHLKASSLMFCFSALFLLSAMIISDGKEHLILFIYLTFAIVMVIFSAYTQWNWNGLRKLLSESYAKVASFTVIVHVVGDEILASSLETLDYSRIEYKNIKRNELSNLDNDSDIILIDQKENENLEDLKSLVIEVDRLNQIPILLLVNDKEAKSYFEEHLKDYKSEIYLKTRPPFSSQVFIQIFEIVKIIKSKMASNTKEVQS